MQVALFDENISEFGRMLTQSNLPITEAHRVTLLLLENFKSRIWLNLKYFKNVSHLGSNSLKE